jgi:hypothetical protein
MKIDLDANISLRQLQEYGQRVPETILLPPPDESKDELFYPPNGFKPADEGKEAGEPKVDAKPPEPEKPKAEPEPSEFDKLFVELAGIVAEVENRGHKIPKAQKERLNALRKVDEIKKALDYYVPILRKLEGGEEQLPLAK